MSSSRYLLDSHVVLWALTDPAHLSQESRDVILDQGNDILFSPIMAWELLSESVARKLKLPDDFMEYVQNARFTELPIRSAHAVLVSTLPLHHKDPFDRMLVAQAQAEGLTIVTRDKSISLYDVPVLLA